MPAQKLDAGEAAIMHALLAYGPGTSREFVSFEEK